METNQERDKEHLSGRPEKGVSVTPVIEERLRVDTEEVETGRVRVVRRVHEDTETLNLPVVEERLEVERTPRNVYVETAPEVRYEGDILIIPVLREEVVTVTKLLLVEEVRIKKHRTESVSRQEVTLRRDEVTVERLPPDEASTES